MSAMYPKKQIFVKPAIVAKNALPWRRHMLSERKIGSGGIVAIFNLKAGWECPKKGRLRPAELKLLAKTVPTILRGEIGLDYDAKKSIFCPE